MHEIIKCSCGAVISQCRCPAPDKKVTTIENGCEDCKKQPPTLGIHVSETIKPQDSFGRR